MQITLTCYGFLENILGPVHPRIAEHTDELVDELIKDFPSLANTKLIIAVNSTIIHKNTILKKGDQVALMPPYSGG